MNSDKLILSIVIPAFNEVESLDELVLRLTKVICNLGNIVGYEIIIIDDGSTDGTWQKIVDLKSQGRNIIGIKMRGRFGKSLALMSGFTQSVGDYVITLDADLQDNPEDIPLLLSKILEGYDLVCGARMRRSDSLMRKIGSKIYNKVTSMISGIELTDINCGFKIYSKSLVNNLHIYGQLHRYIPIQAYLMGFKIDEVAISNSERRYGNSKYPAMRYEGFFDLMSIMFTYKHAHTPLYFFGSIAMIFMIPSSIVLTYLCGAHLIYLMGYGESFNLFNRPLLAIVLSSISFGGVFLMTGFVCDFILHHSTRGKANNLTNLYVSDKLI